MSTRSMTRKADRARPFVDPCINNALFVSASL
jgi:hypothetical protein